MAAVPDRARQAFRILHVAFWSSATTSTSPCATSGSRWPPWPWPWPGWPRRSRPAPPCCGRPRPTGRRVTGAADEGLADTPRRVAAAFAELLTPPPFSPTTFPNSEGYDELVVARSIPFASLCQHHLLPFCGVAHVGYLPGDRILGLCKLARVVELFARDLQTQERLTGQVAGWLQERLDPRTRAEFLALATTMRG